MELFKGMPDDIVAMLAELQVSLRPPVEKHALL